MQPCIRPAASLAHAIRLTWRLASTTSSTIAPGSAVTSAEPPPTEPALPPPDAAENARWLRLSQNWERTRLGWLATGDADAGLRPGADVPAFAAAVVAAKRARKRRYVRVNSKSILSVSRGGGGTARVHSFPPASGSEFALRHPPPARARPLRARHAGHARPDRGAVCLHEAAAAAPACRDLQRGVGRICGRRGVTPRGRADVLARRRRRGATAGVGGRRAVAVEHARRRQRGSGAVAVPAHAEAVTGSSCVLSRT